MDARTPSEGPFYTTLRDGDTITVVGEIPLRIAYVEKYQNRPGLVGIAIDPPLAKSVRFDAATRTLTLIAGLP